MKIEHQNSRDEFIRQVANAIEDAQNDSERQESFIFGLSAKWGEGKTTFIDGLEGKLGEAWVRIAVNPWKYSDNKITFLQAFLIELVSKYSGCPVKKADILQSRNETTLAWNKKSVSLWVAVAAYLALTALIAFLASVHLKNNTNLLSGGVATLAQAGITFVLGTVLIPLLSRTATATVSDRTTTTLIEFDEKLEKIIKSYGDKKLLIVVDDLDRISAKDAVLVLDNLRTFFDRKELCFVVSGDHSVMERHIGKELLPDGEPEERLEEGRRYLKKIFNIYWRMPIPTNAEIENYISETIEAKLQDVGSTEAETGQLATLLNGLFENNYRNIERMISQIAFTFQIVQGKLDSCSNDDETRIYYEDLLRHKMLLVKVLLIQELANPYYEYLLIESDSLRLSDKGQKALRSDGNPLRSEKGASEVQLTERQFRNLIALIKSEPKFHDVNGLVVYDMKPFIYLSADSNFGDHRGLLPSEFHERLSESLSDKNEFEKLLDQHGVEMLHKGIAAMIEEQKPAIETAPEMVKLLKRLNDLGTGYSAQVQEFKVYFAPEAIAEYAGLGAIEYAERIFLLGELYQGDTAYVDRLVKCTDRITAQEYLYLIDFAEKKSVNPLFESVLWRCFENLAAQNMNSFIIQFGTIVDKLGGHSLPDNILSVLVDRIRNNYVDATGQIAAKIILKSGNVQYTDKAVEETKALLPQQHSSLIEILRILDASNADQTVLAYVDMAGNYQELYKRMQFAMANGLGKDKVWQHVIDSRFDILIGCIAFSTPNLHPSSPSEEKAKLLAQKVVRYAKENDQNSLLTNIDQTAFLFANLNSIRGDAVVTKYLGRLKRSGDEINSSNAKRLLSLGEERE